MKHIEASYHKQSPLRTHRNKWVFYHTVVVNELQEIAWSMRWKEMRINSGEREKMLIIHIMRVWVAYTKLKSIQLIACAQMARNMELYRKTDKWTNREARSSTSPPIRNDSKIISCKWSMYWQTVAMTTGPCRPATEWSDSCLLMTNNQWSRV